MMTILRWHKTLVIIIIINLISDHYYYYYNVIELNAFMHDVFILPQSLTSSSHLGFKFNNLLQTYQLIHLSPYVICSKCSLSPSLSFSFSLDELEIKRERLYFLPLPFFLQFCIVIIQQHHNNLTEKNCLSIFSIYLSIYFKTCPELFLSFSIIIYLFLYFTIYYIILLLLYLISCCYLKLLSSFSTFSTFHFATSFSWMKEYQKTTLHNTIPQKKFWTFHFLNWN